MSVLVKTLNGLAYASIKTRNGLAVASIKAINGLDVTSSGGSPSVISANVKQAFAIGGGSNVLTLTGVDCTGANFLIVPVVAWDGATSADPTGVTYNGVAMTKTWAVQNPSFLAYIAFYYLKAPTSGAHSVVVTYAAAYSNQIVGAIPMSGVNQTTPLGTPATNTGGPGTTSSVTVSSATGELVVGAMYGNTSGLTVSSDTLIIDLDDTDGDQPNVASIAGASSVTMNWTLPSSMTWQGGAVSVKA